MSKKFFSFLLIATLPIISACHKDTSACVISINNKENAYQFIELNLSELTNLIDSGQGFVLEMYSEYCSHCQDLEPLLETYSMEYSKVIYRFNCLQIETAEEFEELLMTPYPDIFTDYLVPKIKYIKDKSLTYEVNSNKHSSYYALKTVMNSHFISSSISMVSTIEGFNSYVNDNEDYIAFAYDIDNLSSLETANNYLINEDIAKAKKNVLLLNKAGFSIDFVNVQAYFETEEDNFISFVKNNENEKTIDYLSTDGSSLSDLISNF